MAPAQGDGEQGEKALANPLSNKIQKILGKQLEDDKVKNIPFDAYRSFNNAC